MSQGFELINTYSMAAFNSISNILGKFSPAQRLLVEQQTDRIIVDHQLSPLLNNQIQYEETIQINSPVFTTDSISIMGVRDATQFASDSTLSKGKIPWIRCVLGRTN